MEANGFESLKHLDFTLEEQNKIIEAYEQENKAIKDRWEKLKKIISQKQNIKNKSDAGLIALFGCVGVESFCKMLLEKMQELEKGE